MGRKYFPLDPIPVALHLSMVKYSYQFTYDKEGSALCSWHEKRGSLRAPGSFFSPSLRFLPIPISPVRPLHRMDWRNWPPVSGFTGAPAPFRAQIDTGYELISGERRLRASQLAGLTEVPCILVHVDDEASSLLALIENLQRRDLDFVEEAAALARLIRTFHLSQEEAARKIGKSQSAVANKLRLLRLPPDVLALLREKHFSERHARALLRLETSEDQRAAARFIVEHHLTVARTEEYVEGLLSPAPAPRRKPSSILKDVRLFLNSVTKGLTLMKSAGVDAACDRQDTEDSILLTIRIPKQSRG